MLWNLYHLFWCERPFLFLLGEKKSIFYFLNFSVFKVFFLSFWAIIFSELIVYIIHRSSTPSMVSWNIMHSTISTRALCLCFNFLFILVEYFLCLFFHQFIIGRFTSCSCLLFQFFEILLEIVFLNLVFLVNSKSPSPFAGMKDRKCDSENHYSSQIKREVFKNSHRTIIYYSLTTWVTNGKNRKKVSAISAEP